jgi:hypothetical protein
VRSSSSRTVEILQQEEMLERQDLPPIAQGALRQEADLGEAVEDDARRLQPFDLGQHHLHGLAELEIGRMHEALLLFRVEAELRRDELEDRNPFEGPAMGRGDGLELAFAFGKRDVKPALSPRDPVHEELQAKRGLARARLALHEVSPIGRVAAVEKVIKAGNSRRDGGCVGAREPFRQRSHPRHGGAAPAKLELRTEAIASASVAVRQAGRRFAPKRPEAAFASLDLAIKRVPSTACSIPPASGRTPIARRFQATLSTQPPCALPRLAAAGEHP